MKIKTYLLALSLTLIFFGVSLFTLSDYGISWDETIHFYRGQAYLHYFLTGKLNYDGLPQMNLQGTFGDPSKITIPRRSFYQNDLYNGEYMLKNDSGHPPINGELSALSNFIFYQKLGILGDIQSHHLFNILASSLLVFVVISLAGTYFGSFTALISFLALVTYPLFWAESHFNIKDPPETAFFATAIWAFINSLQKTSLYWLILFWVFLGLALGTKFNILFLPFILIPYLLFYYRKFIFSKKFSFKKIPKTYLGGLILGPIITLGIFIGSWPYLWQKWPENLISILKFYREIGTNAQYQPDNFFILGFNTFPSLWILFTTSPLVLVLFFIGIVALFINRGGPKLIGVLWILWFIVPLLRVTMPGSSIYGGIRQIMEFLPAMALLSGFGAWQIIQWFKTKHKIFSVQLMIILFFMWPLFVLIKLHPNENVYFNSFIGGLPGASERNFPSWGNSFGNAYFQGIEWINRNALYSSKVALLQGTLANAPLIFFRKDLQYIPSSNVEDKITFFSGIERKGEYLMELTFNNTGKDFFYVWEYVDKFLVPVYQVKVDNIAILKIWKNDFNHTNKEFKLSPAIYNGSINFSNNKNIFYINLDKEILLSNIEINYNEISNCIPLKIGFVETSLDRIDWQAEKDNIPQYQIYRKINLEKNKINYYFAGRNAKYIRFVLDSNNSCIFNNYQVKVFSLI